jgi:MFS family permease
VECAEWRSYLVAADPAKPTDTDGLGMMMRRDGVDSPYAWRRLVASVTLSTLGGIGMWALSVALPVVQTDLGVSRADISAAYSANMIGFFLGGVATGRLVDRRGIVFAAIVSTLGLVTGFGLASLTSSLLLFAAAQMLIGFSAAATFAPLVADISHWFEKRRGVAVAIAASGNYIAGAIWPPIVELMISQHGWRTTYLLAGALCLATMIPLALALKRRAPDHETAQAVAVAHRSLASLGLTPNGLQALLVLAGISCCVAMSMPQVHIVAYCADRGFGVARGAEMLSLMLGFGIVSRVGSGWLADKVGGAMTLMIGSTLQGVALLFYLVADSVTSLYLASALFGLFQGGIVPSYAIIVREYFPAREAASRVGLTVSSTVLGMALGGWMGGALFDLTGSYRAAFINGIGWNVLNAGIAWWLLSRQMRRAAA